MMLNIEKFSFLSVVFCAKSAVTLNFFNYSLVQRGPIIGGFTSSVQIPRLEKKRAKNRLTLEIYSNRPLTE